MRTNKPSELHEWIAGHGPTNPLVVTPADAGRIESYAVHGPYPERFWLPLIGPSALVVWRCLVAAIIDHGDHETRPLMMPLDHLAAAVGLGAVNGPSARIVVTLGRMHGFGIVKRDVVADTLAVRVLAPELTDRQESRLPAWLAVEHRDNRFDRWAA